MHAGCGGRGHAGSVDGVDCLTKQLGINIPRSELAATKYPNGLKFPILPNRKSVKQVSEEVDDSRHDDDQQPDDADSSDSQGSVTAKFAVVYHTIDTSESKYDSMNDDSSSDIDSKQLSSRTSTSLHKPKSAGKQPASSSKRSATTKANTK